MKSVSVSQKAYSLLMFFAVSVLSGLLLAGLAVPFTALAGGAVRMGAESMRYLPAELETPPQSERSQILMADGSVLATFFDENRIYVPLDDIAPVMQDAQIAIEDHRFYEHGAIDPQGIIRAVFRNVAGDQQGASTLTQQYVKLVQVEAAHLRGDAAGVQEAQAPTIERKIREMRYAMAVEERFSKQEILERYLNIAYFGDGAYGVEAAARHYWGTTASELTLDQAAMLAGLVQNPVQTNPAKYPAKAVERRNVVLNRMAQLGYVTQEAADEAKEVPFDPEGIQRTPNGCTSAEFPFLCDYVSLTLVKKMEALGETEEARRNMLNRGGLIIQTLIDPQAQRRAEAAVAAQIAPTDPLIATTSLIQPSTGLIVAMAQSRPVMGDGPGESWWNYNVNSEMGGTEGYQSASTFKTFAVAAALEAGMTPSKQYNAPYAWSVRGNRFKTCEGTYVSNEDHQVKNLDRSYGNIDMRTALDRSVNTYFMQLGRDVGLCEVKEMAERLGIEYIGSKEHIDNLDAFPTLVLGTAEIAPLSMTSAYATLANRGVRCDPIIVKSVQNADGVDMEVPSANCREVLDPEVADGVTYLLESVMSRGFGRPARIPDGRPQGGKTGTAQSASAVWFAGYTPDLAGSSMITIDKTSEFYTNNRTRSVSSPVLASGRRLAGTGGGDAGQMWKTAMGEALKDTPHTDFTEVSDRILQGVQVEVPDVSGMSYEDAKRVLEEAGFTTVRWNVYHNSPKGTYLGISPTGTAPKFSTISMRFSAGPKPAPPPPPDPEPEPSDDESTPEPEDPPPSDGEGSIGDGGDSGDSGDSGDTGGGGGDG